jgi:hypothetical protein
MQKILNVYTPKPGNKTPFAANLKKETRQPVNQGNLVTYNRLTKQITVRRYSFDDNGGGYQGL